MTRIFKIGSTKIAEDESMAGLSLDEIRERLKSMYPEVAEATVREKEDAETDVTFVEFLARPGRKG
jgi:hypothetical protein